MRIFHTVASLGLNTGGPARSVPGLASAAAKAGAEVHLWAPEIPEKIEEPTGVTLHRGDFPDIEIDLLHDHGVWLPNNHRMAQWARSKKIPRIVSPRGMLEPWAINHNKWKKKIAWWLYQRRDLKSATAFHATAESEAAQFRKLGLDQESFVIPNGIDFSEFKGNSTKEKTVVFLSRIHPKKGLLMWVDVWKRIRPEGWRMRVIGPDEGGHTEEVKRAVAQADLSDEWSFEGPLEGKEKLSALGSAQLFALPTYSENFGIVVAEALAAGTPVITTTGTPWEGLIEHRCGWWADPTPEALAKALQSALACEERSLMGQRGANWVKNEFSWEEIGLRIVAAYRNILNGH